MKNFLKKFKYFIFGIVIFFLYYKILPIFITTIIQEFINNPNNMVKNIVLSIAEITIFLVLFLIFRKTIVKDFKDFIKNYSKHLNIGFKYYFVGFLVMIASNLLLTFIFGGMAANEELNREYIKLYPLYSVVAMVFVGPLIEEIVFRLGFRKAFSKWLPYALFSGIFFGLLHVFTAYEGMTLAQALKNWHQFLYIVPYSALGVAFAKAYFETDNICTTMTIHLLHNAFTVFLIFTTM